MKRRYYWLTVAVVGPHSDVWRFTETVSTDHPFTVIGDWGAPNVFGLATLLAWREITAAEYALHGEHDPYDLPRAAKPRKRDEK